jgi:hypothetical protein
MIIHRANCMDWEIEVHGWEHLNEYECYTWGAIYHGNPSESSVRDAVKIWWDTFRGSCDLNTFMKTTLLESPDQVHPRFEKYKQNDRQR